MKFSTIKTGKGGQHLTGWPADKFFSRITTDANNRLITMYRAEFMADAPTRYGRYKEIPQVFAAVELSRQQNGAIGTACYNGLVVLEVHQLMSERLCADVKRAAMSMPTTLAAFTGASGTEVIILVSVVRADGSLPKQEHDTETFYTQAYHNVARLYDAVLPVRVTRMTPTPLHAFLFPMDSEPLVNNNATPVRIAIGNTADGTSDDGDVHLLALPEERSATEKDMTAYSNYERAYAAAATKVQLRLAGLASYTSYTTEWYKAYVTGMAHVFCTTGWPEEEAVCHLWHHLEFRDAEGLTEEFVRRLVTAVYDEEAPVALQSPATDEPLMQQLIRRMESRYAMRYNTVMGYTEYRANCTWVTPWRPVTDKVINTFTTDLHLAGLNVWDRDVRRYINSTRVHDYNPISDYLRRVASLWDGNDHIRQLAATVPTDNPRQWADWFHTWFLAMVAQWQGRDRRYGNAIVPLLVSPQGMRKSAFCRLLLPPELRQWGYTDNLSLSEERPVHLAMAQMLLINLDEFNSISPQKQQGFLKNILQLPSVKVKRPYASHTEEVPRLASFIATTNMADVLTDPTGSRRFLGIQVTGSIDVSQTPNYVQLYAQAQQELDSGARYWFDDAETEAIIGHNRMFQRQQPVEMFFHQYYDVPESTEQKGEWMTTTEILVALKRKAGAVLQAPSAIAFGRILTSMPGLLSRHTRSGTEFYVREKAVQRRF